MLLTRRFLVVVALAASVAGVSACNRHDGTDVKQHVAQALDREKIDGVNIDWDKDAKVVHLKGTVDSDAKRARAEALATQAVGTSGKVANELTLKGTDARTADNLDGTLEDHIENLLKQDQSVRDRDIDVHVNNGVVTLKGDVPTEQDRQRITETVGRVPGVQNVVNSLQVKAQH
jgi:hyperosmotically inducible periplasmic protein